MKGLKNTTYQKKTNVGHDSMFDTQKVKRKSEQLFFTSEGYRRKKKIAVQEMHCNQKETFCMDNEPLQTATEEDWNLLQ